MDKQRQRLAGWFNIKLEQVKLCCHNVWHSAGWNCYGAIDYNIVHSGYHFYNESCRAPAGTITASVYLKKGNTTSADLRVRNQTTSTILSSATVDLDAGTISGTGWTISNEGSGWYRCKYTTSSGVTVGDTLRFYVAHVGNTSASGNTYYYWAAQIEPGSVATAYRPTTSTLESAANANIAGFSSAGYTLAVDTRSDVVLSGLNVGLHVNDGTVNNRAMVYQNTTSKAISLVVSGGGTAATLTMAAGQPHGRSLVHQTKQIYF